ncbi:hypothetical protein ACFLT9_08485 [Acidobacteriota bacterium]
MTKIKKEKNRKAWILQFWARLIGTTFIGFTLLMAVGSLFSKSEGMESSAATEGLVITFFLLFALAGIVIAWFREWIGGLVLTIVGMAGMIIFLVTYPPVDYWVALILCVPLLFSGILFLICGSKLRKI